MPEDTVTDMEMEVPQQLLPQPLPQQQQLQLEPLMVMDEEQVLDQVQLPQQQQEVNKKFSMLYVFLFKRVDIFTMQYNKFSSPIALVKFLNLSKSSKCVFSTQ